MSRQSRRIKRNRAEQSATLPKLLVIVTVVTFIAIFIFINQNKIDPVTSCLKSGSYPVITVIIDTSDPLAPHQIVSFEKFAKSLLHSPAPEEIVTANSDSNNYVPKGHRLIAYEIADETKEPKKLFDNCSPGNPEARGIGEQLTEGEIWAEIRWEEFTQKLKAALPRKTLKKTAPISPIIETIRHVRRAEYPSSSELKASKKKAGTIFIISDMLQNSNRISHFDTKLPAVENVPSLFALDLTGIDIGIRYLKSEQYMHLQQPIRPHFTWWRKFFSIAGSPLRLPPEEW